MIRATNHMRQTLFVLFTILTFGLTAQSTFTVSNTNDSGAGSLRQAITDANASSGADIIDMTDISGTILLESALPKINESLTINGPGEHLLSISGQELYRPFFANSGTVNLNNFSIINGLAKGGDGGTLYSGGGGGAGMGGGLIANVNVNLTLEDITFSNNQAVGGNGGGAPSYANQGKPGSAGGSGPFHGTTAPSGRNGNFGSGGSSGAVLLSASYSGNTSGGNGGYGAGGGGAGNAAYRSNGNDIPEYPGGMGGKFGGNGGLNKSGSQTSGRREGGGGAGLGGAIFSRANTIHLKNIAFADNFAQGGERYSMGGENIYSTRGQGKGGALFIYSEAGNVTDFSWDGIALSGNSAQDALNLDTDNGDIYLEEGLSFVDNTVFALRRSDPEDGGNYINGQPIVFFYNQEIYNFTADPITVEDLESNIQFRNSLLEDIPFTVSVNTNRISISPLEDLVANENYTILIGTVYDRDGVAQPGGSAQFQIDTNAPGFDISPANNQLITSRSFQLKANEAIFKLDGSDIQDSDISAIVTVKLADENGADVPFSGSIVNNTLHIDITDPIANQTYYVAVNSVEDLAGNEHTTAQTFSIKSPAGLAFTSDPANGGVLGKRLFSISADQALYDLDDTPLTSQDLASKLALKETDMNGADIAFDAFVEGKSIYIATNQLASAGTYWVSVQGIEDITGIEIAQQEFTFSTTNLFNPVSGSGHAVSFFGGKLDFTSIEITGDFTLEAWVKTTDEDGMLLGNSNPSNLGFGLESGKLTFNTTAQSVVSTSSINDGTLHHVAMTNEAGSINLYIDGVLDGTGTVIVASTRTVTALGNGFIGNNPSQLTADIDEVRIWNVALDATNIANYQSISLDNTHPNLSDLVALFAFDESKGQYALDYNGSLVNGILSGDYSWKTSEVTFPAAQFEISVNGQVIVLDGSYDMGSVVLNQSSAPKTFQIENTGTADLLLRGNPFVGITGLGASQFTIDEASTVSLLAPGATTSFTVTYSPTIAGLSQAALIIENGSINDPFKLSLKGTGLDITTSGNWQLLGGRPGAFHVDGGVGSVVYNGELYTTSVSKDGTQQGIFKLVGEDLVYYGNSNRQPYLYASSGGTFFTTAKQAGGNVIRSIVDYGGGSISSGYQFNVPSQPTGVSTSYESEFTMGFDSQDNSFVVYAANFAEPAAFNAATGGLDIKKFVQNGSGYEDYAQLSTQSLKPGTYFGNENIYSYDIDFDSNDNLWVVSKGYRYDLFLSKYNDTNDTWTHYDLTSNLNGTYYSRDLKMEIDGDDNIHILDKVQFDNKLKYLKVASNGSVLVSDEHTASMKTTDKRFELAIGTDNNPIIVYVDDNTKRFRAIKHENGAFANFRNTHITNDLAPSGDRYFDFSIDPVTGKAYLVYISETIYGKSIVTTSEIVPELSFSIGDKLVSGEVPVVLQSGVGYEKALVLNIANDGQSIVNFTGNPHLTGDNVEDIEFDFDTFPTSLFPGESVDVPVTFFPTAVYESEVTLAFPSNATGSGSEVTFKLFGLDDTNSGNWILYTDSNLGAMNSIDMTLYNGEPIWVSNRARYKGGFQNPNRGNQFETLYTVQLELFDASSTEPLATRDYFSNDVNAAPTLIWDEFYLNQFQNLKIEIDPALDVPTLITNGVNGVSTYVPNTDGGFESLIREGYNEFGDLVFDSSNEFYYLKLESSNLVIRRGLDNSYVVSFSGLSNPNTDMDLEAYGDDLYFTYGDNTSLEVRSTAKNAATNSDMTTLLSASDVRFSQAAQSKTKDLEFSYDGQLYLAYIINSTGNVAFKSYDKLATSWTDLPTLDLSSVLPDANAIQDIQLEIHPDGSPYISIVYDDSPTNGFSIVFRLENNVWVQQSSANFFTYGGTNVSDSPVGHVAETEPIIKKSVLEISDEGTIYWLSGFKLNMMIPTPDAFDKVPSFATTPSTSTVEESSSFAYDIVVEDADAGDAITIFATGVPSWLTFTDNGDRTASLIGTPSDEDVADYTITLTASDGRISVTQEVAIEVTNINDDPDFFIEDIIYYIDQNNQGMTIEISGITDGDAGLEQNLTFSVTSDNTALVNNQSVNYIAGESTATLEFSHNQEVHGDAYLTVRLEDEVGLFKEQVVRINVVEGIVYLIASNPSGTLLFDENQPEGTEIATIFASDVDFNETYTFSLVAGLGDNQNDLFNVVENSLQLTGNLNYESVSTPSIRLRGDNGEGTTYETYFIISLNDLNDAPTDILLSESTIDEGAEVGSVIGTLSATDEDAANVHTYTLVDGFGDNTSFQIVGNDLQVAEVFDFDVKSIYSIQVELDDSGVILTRDFTITVNNINVAPSAITLSNSSIPENSYGDFLIGSLSAVDGDDEDTHTFGFTGVAGLETDDFKLINGDLYTNRNFDFEIESSLQVEIYARDNNAESVDQIFTISITDANDVPTGLTISSSEVEEAQPAGTEIGLLSALDPDAGDTHTYTLVSGFDQNYAVDIVGNSLQTAVELDFDVLPVLNLKINVNDGNGGVNEFELTIDVINVNHEPTAITLSNDNIDEDAVVGSIIGTLSTTDADVDDTHTYEVLTSIQYEGTTIFPIVADGANLVTTVPLDFETLPIFNIDVKVTDAEGLTFTESFTLYTNNVNEAPTSMALNANTIAENTAAGVRIGQLIAVDPDANDPLTYTLVSGEGDEDNAFFQIGGAGNELENEAVLDFEAQSTYSVRARATDAAGLFYEEAFTIHVVDGNDQPTAIAISSSEIDEDAPVGSVIGSLTTTDEDVNDQHTYEVLEINYQTTQQFIMDGANLITTVPLDFETTPAYRVVIEATDEGGLAWPEVFEITVNDVNEAPTAIALSKSDIDEDAEPGSIIGTLSTTDQDVDDTHTYEVLTSMENEGTTIFPIVADGANLVTTIPLDFETIPTLVIEVQSTDAGGLSFIEYFMLTANDKNDAPTAITLSSNSIDENAPVGTLIGSLTAVDQDAGATHTFTLVSGFGDNASFDISGNELQNSTVFDFETKPNYTIKVKADDGAGGVFEQEFDIAVNNVSEGSAQTITFDALEARTFGDEPFELTATASSGMTVAYTSSDAAIASVSGSTVIIHGAGVVTITASQPGTEGTFKPATPVSQQLIINKASQTISFDALADQISGADPITLSASSTSGLEVTFTATGAAVVLGNILTLEGSGQVIVTASQSGNDNYNSASDVVRSFVVKDPAKTDQTITFDPPAIVYLGDEAIELAATSDSGLDVVFEIISGGDFVSRSGNVLNLMRAGTVVVSASQGGNDTFNAASISKTIVIKPVFEVSGKVTNETGGAFSAGTVVLLAPGKTNGIGVELDASGNYQFSDVKDGTYYIGVIPDDESAYYATAFGNTIIYQNSTTITVADDDISGIDIQMVAKDSGNELTGDGVVTGRVIEDDGSGSRIAMGRILEGTPIEGASIFLVRKSDDKILTEVFSDANGDFTISGIPEGSFSILINIPGVEGSVSSDITVQQGTQVLMTAMVGEDGIVFESQVTEALSLRDIQTSLKVYPNPVVDMIRVSFEGSVSRLDWRLITLSGLEIERGTLKEVNETTINVSALSNGIYFLVLQDEMGFTKQIKVIK